MKQTTLIILAATILFASCTKKSSSSPSPAAPSIPSNGWKLGTNTYTTAHAMKTGVTLSAMDAIPSGPTSTANTCVLYFSSIPTASGTYHIVNFTPAGSSVLTASQIGVTAGINGNAATYASTGMGGLDATVTLTGGKLKVVIPTVWVKQPGGADSLQFTGTIIEN